LQSQPKFYSDYDYFNFLFSPTPDSAYPFELLYWQLPTLLDAANQTNWSTDHAPNALLHGSLVQAYGLLKDEKREAKWQGRYDRDLGLLNGEDIQKIIDRSAIRKEA